MVQPPDDDDDASTGIPEACAGFRAPDATRTSLYVERKSFTRRVRRHGRTVGQSVQAEP